MMSMMAPTTMADNTQSSVAADTRSKRDARIALSEDGGGWDIIVGGRLHITTRIKRRRAGVGNDTTDAMRAVACIRFIRHVD